MKPTSLYNYTQIPNDKVGIQADGHLQSFAAQDAPSRSTDHHIQIIGIWLLRRFQLSGDLDHLQSAIASLEKAVRSTSDQDDWYCALLGDLGVALWYRFNHIGGLSDLEESISVLMVALGLTPDGHPDKHARLSSLGYSFFTRFERLGASRDLDEAISMLRDAVDITPPGHPDNLARLGNLGRYFLARFQHLGKLSDIDGAISRHRDVVDLTPHGHPDKPSCLTNLATCFRLRFTHSGQLDDLAKAISIHTEAVQLALNGCTNKRCRPLARAECHRQPSDLEWAVSMQREALRLTPDGHPFKAHYMNNLASCLLARFEHLGELSDLDDATLLYEDAVQTKQTPVMDPVVRGSLRS